MADRYVLTQPYRARPYAIGALADLLGAVLLVIGIEQGITVLIVIAVIAFALGASIIAAAMLARQRLRTVVDLTDQGLEISSGGQRAGAQWGDISGVRTDQRTIYLERTGADQALRISSPAGAEDPQLSELSAELTSRLDANRGYRRLS